MTKPYFADQLPVKPTRFPSIRTVRHEHGDTDRRFAFHNNIVVQYSETDEQALYCGDHWCHGECDPLRQLR